MIRTRFAPSPTGYLHIGGARTALFCWLYTKKMGGEFILRIEDTDRERSTDESVQAILNAMMWLGLDYDEGPLYQTKRFDRYYSVIEQLIDSGDAYYCSCSKQRLEALRAEQMLKKQKPRYDGCCRGKNLTPDQAENTVVRFKNPQHGDVVFNDLVKGTIKVSNEELDDLIIKRSDGTPTYNLTVVVDDMDMKITQVIRGDDHVNNTPRQINIFKALNAEIPEYAHVPMILGEDGKRLSKRHGAMSVMQYFEEGYLPDALLNYLLRLGWSSGDQEIFSREEMIRLFSLQGINRAPSIFNSDKLGWINQQYMKKGKLEDIVFLVKQQLEKEGVVFDHRRAISGVVDLYRQRVRTIRELAQNIRYVFEDFKEFDPTAAKKVFKASALKPLQMLSERFELVRDWNAEAIHGIIQDITNELEINMGKVGQPLRVAVTGGSFSPPIDQTVEIIGKENSIRRIQLAINLIQNKYPVDDYS